MDTNDTIIHNLCFENMAKSKLIFPFIALFVAVVTYGQESPCYYVTTAGDTLVVEPAIQHGNNIYKVYKKNTCGEDEDALKELVLNIQKTEEFNNACNTALSKSSILLNPIIRNLPIKNMSEIRAFATSVYLSKSDRCR